jgi:hypothetical protein
MAWQSAPKGMRVRTQFPRFQDEYSVLLQENVKDAPTATGAHPPYCHPSIHLSIHDLIQLCKESWRAQVCRVCAWALSVTVKFSIGRVFDVDGNFWEEGLSRQVAKAVEKFRRKDFDQDKGKDTKKSK